SHPLREYRPAQSRKDQSVDRLPRYTHETLRDTAPGFCGALPCSRNRVATPHLDARGWPRFRAARIARCPAPSPGRAARQSLATSCRQSRPERPRTIVLSRRQGWRRCQGISGAAGQEEFAWWYYSSNRAAKREVPLITPRAARQAERAEIV